MKRATNNNQHGIAFYKETRMTNLDFADDVALMHEETKDLHRRIDRKSQHRGERNRVLH